MQRVVRKAKLYKEYAEERRKICAIVIKMEYVTQELAIALKNVMLEMKTATRIITMNVLNVASIYVSVKIRSIKSAKE